MWNVFSSNFSFRGTFLHIEIKVGHFLPICDRRSRRKQDPSRPRPSFCVVFLACQKVRGLVARKKNNFKTTAPRLPRLARTTQKEEEKAREQNNRKTKRDLASKITKKKTRTLDWARKSKRKKELRKILHRNFVHETRRNWPHSAENGIAAVAGSRSPEVAHPECTARNRKTCVKIIIVPEPHNTHSGYWLPLFLMTDGRRHRTRTSFRARAELPASKITQQTSVPPLLL